MLTETIGKSRLKSFVLSLAAAAAFVALSVPAFNMTGIIIKPVLLCLSGGAVISIILCLRREYKAVGTGQLFFVCFWLVTALVKEAALQLENGFVDYWIEFFYFDKLLVVGSVWFGSAFAAAFYRVAHRKTLAEDYSAFFRHSSLAFLVFYSFLLLYSFVLIRLQPFESQPNMVPFATIKEYISQFSRIPYEVLMMALGNLFYFTPLGYVFAVVLRKKSVVVKYTVLLVFPLAAFSLLEFSQYYFQNGFCEFDDISMNTLGFWFGAAACPLADCVSRKLSKDKVFCFWE